LAAAPPAAPLPSAPPEEEPQPSTARLGVKAREWSYTLSRPEVPAGEVAIELNNQGEDPHDLNLRLEGSEGPPLQVPITGSLQRTTRRFTLSTGTYRLWCDLPEHDERGMHATLVVSGSG
jgi:plastocyanin